MLKKIIFSFVVFFLSFQMVYASSNTAAKIGNNYYDTLSDAIANANSTDIIKLLSNVNLTETLLINKTVNIDLNGNNISAPSIVFLVQGGTLNLNGTGTIRETEPNYGAIKVIGSNNNNDNKYSLVNIEKNVSLEGWSGIFVSHESNKSYGVYINFDGKINAISDINGGTGVGIYVNGNIKDEINSPIINILENAEIYSNGNGLYIAGYSVWNIYQAYIHGIESGISIKSGILNIDGATVICDGEDKTPTEGYNNGIKASGTTIQIESNSGYAGNMEINIKNGNFKSKNSNVIYEYIGKGNNTTVNSINITGGTFISDASKEIFLLSPSFKEKHPKFISGGNFSSNPNLYLKSGYTSTLDNNLYRITASTMKEIFSVNKDNNKSPILPKVIIIFIIIIIIVFAYINKSKLALILKKLISKFSK